MKCLKDWMLLEEIKQDPGKVIVPDSVKRDEKSGLPSLWKVLQMGPGWWDRDRFTKSEDVVKIGDIVLLEGIDAAKFTIHGKLHRAARVREVAMILEGKDK